MNRKLVPDILSELKQYSEDIITGKILACKKHKCACQRFLNDVAKSANADYPYQFDAARAERFFAWTRLFKHHEGPLQGQYINLVPLQRFILGNVFGWINKETGFRRFTKLFWQVARKNAKSQTLALILTYLCFADGEQSAQIFCAATKVMQARVVYDVCVKHVRQALPKETYKIAYGRIEHVKSGSYIRYLSSEDKKLGDGYNPHGVSIDEYHAHQTSEMYDVLASGMGARAQPLHCTITTAGFDLEYPCYRVEYLLVSKILDPNLDFDIENYFCMVNELDKDDQGQLVDDITDESCWIKSNPIVATYPVGVKGLREAYKEALGISEKMRDFLTKRMNVWVNMRECGYMDMVKWKNCEIKEEELPDMSNIPCYIGIDLSAKIDLTSVGFIWPYKDVYYVFSHSFMPEETIMSKMKTDRVPYLDWVEQGYITSTSGAVIDYRAVKDWTLEKVKAWHLRVAEYCVDSWGMIQISNDLIELGNVVVEVIQGIKSLSEPTKDFREMVYAKRMLYISNPVLSWAMSNAIVDTPDRGMNIILNKKKSIQRIDPVAALINAHVRAMNKQLLAAPKVIFI